jgi:DNA-binding Xre family transcriptional regulator
MTKKRMRGRKLVRVKLRIKEVAESRGFTQTKLSRQAELQYPTVHGLWTNPYRDASINTLAKIAKVLNVPVSDLFEIMPDDEK